jgi:hypothetical protein
MDERKAKALAKLLGGDPWQSGGDVWLVVKRTADGRVVTISDEVVVEYEDNAAFEANREKASIVVA